MKIVDKTFVGDLKLRTSVDVIVEFFDLSMNAKYCLSTSGLEGLEPQRSCVLQYYMN